MRRFMSCILISLLLLSTNPFAVQADVVETDLPEVLASSYAVIDATSGEVLFGRKYDSKIDPGSLTQLMTAVLILEKGNLNDKVTATAMPNSINAGNTIYLRKNETFTLNELLKAIVIYNANDAAYAAANHIGGSVDKFVVMMNDEAKKLGMTNTEFKNPFGSAKDQKTTALDMARLAAKAASLKKYVELTEKPTMNWNGEMFAHDNIPNACGFQQVMEKGVGLKINNDKSEQSTALHLAASYSKNNRNIVAVISGENNEAQLYKDMKSVLTFGMQETKTMQFIKKDTPLTTLIFGNKEIRLATKDNYSTTVASNAPVKLQMRTVLKKVAPPIKAGDVVGDVKILDGDKEIKSIPLVAMDGVKKAHNWWVIAAVLLALIYLGSIGSRLWHRLTKKSLPIGSMRLPNKMGKKRPPASKPSHTGKNQGQAPTKVNNRLMANRSNPSIGSNEGRKGLEQKVYEQKTRRDVPTRGERPGSHR